MTPPDIGRQRRKTRRVGSSCHADRSARRVAPGSGFRQSGSGSN
jgi:hypothetical protein